MADGIASAALGLELILNDLIAVIESAQEKKKKPYSWSTRALTHYHWC
jgi:hypothetical protein